MEEGSCADKIMTGSILIHLAPCCMPPELQFHVLILPQMRARKLDRAIFFRFFIQEQHEDLTKQIKKIVIYTLIKTVIHHIPYYLLSLAVQKQINTNPRLKV